MNPSLSIIIPTHKRPAILRQTLDHLAKQTIAKELEVIVVHDGEDDHETKQIISILNSQFSILNYFAIPKSQQGIARNRGVEKASTPLTLFIGDDIFLEPDACERHVQAHTRLRHEPLATGHKTQTSSQKPEARSQRPAAILGHTTWDPSLDITPVMLWLERSGWQFGYPMIEQYAHNFIPKNMQERFSYTIHISLPTEIARKFPFREDVSLYGWEDILWGQQLKNAGIPLYYEPDAKGFHHHHITLEQSLKRMETLGKSLKYLEKIAPELHRSPKGLKLLAYRMIALLPTMRGTHSKAFVSGLNK